MKSSLSLQLSQQQTLTLDQLASLDILQMSTLQLEAEIVFALSENPLIESDDLPCISTSATASPSDDEPSVRPNADQPLEQLFEYPLKPESNEDFSPVDNIPTLSSLKDELKTELHCLPESNLHLFLAECLLDELDGHGLLPVSLSQLADEYADVLKEEGYDPVPLEAWEHGLKLLKHIAPIGTGEPNPTAALLAQLEHLQRKEMYPTDAIVALKNILNKGLLNIARQDHKALLKCVDQDEPLLQEALALMQQLKPYPLQYESRVETEFVTPELYVKNLNDRWLVFPVDNPLFHLRLASEKRQSALRHELPYVLWQNYLTEAKLLIHALSARRETLLKIAQFMVDYQHLFFSEGEAGLKPLRLHDIANAVEVAESTVSRAISGKYLYCPQGTIELNALLAGKANSVNQDSDNTISNEKIFALLRQLISQEDPTKPLSDNALVQQLAKHNILIARRTVAKYRDLLGIPTSQVRRRPKS